MDIEEQLALHRLRGTMGLYGLGVTEVARRAGMDKGHVSRVLSGTVRASPATLTRLTLAIHGLPVPTLQADQRPQVAA